MVFYIGERLLLLDWFNTSLLRWIRKPHPRTIPEKYPPSFLSSRIRTNRPHPPSSHPGNQKGKKVCLSPQTLSSRIETCQATNTPPKIITAWPAIKISTSKSRPAIIKREELPSTSAIMMIARESSISAQDWKDINWFIQAQGPISVTSIIATKNSIKNQTSTDIDAFIPNRSHSFARNVVNPLRQQPIWSSTYRFTFRTNKGARNTCAK